MYDADARRKALEPPTLVLDGVTHVGVCLSLDQGDAFRADFERFQAGTADVAFCRDLVTRLFPAIGFSAELVERVITTLPPNLVVEMLVDFSGALLGAKNRPPSDSTTPAPIAAPASA